MCVCGCIHRNAHITWVCIYVQYCSCWKGQRFTAMCTMRRMVQVYTCPSSVMLLLQEPADCYAGMLIPS
jgi:hypothetical protein